MKLSITMEYKSKKPKKNEEAFYNEVVQVALHFAPKMFGELWTARNDAKFSVRDVETTRYKITYKIEP